MELSHKRCTSQPDNIPYLLECKVRFFSLNSALKYVRLCYICALGAELDGAKLDRLELDIEEINQGLHRQITHFMI
jgi:hypothetical protein